MDKKYEEHKVEFEKVYRITEQTSNGESSIKLIKESELTEAHKQLLLGDAIQTFANLPMDLKYKFIAKVNNDEYESDKVVHLIIK